MAKMKVAQVPKAGADFEIVEREIPRPGTSEVRVRVQACGVCHSDVLTKEGAWPGIVFPRVPGHEVAGVIDDVGAGVTLWRKGQRVGVGWHGGQDGTCLACRRGGASVYPTSSGDSTVDRPCSRAMTGTAPASIETSAGTASLPPAI